MIDPETVNRVVLGIIQHHNCSIDEANRIFTSIKLQIVLSEKIRGSLALQAAAITAINCGKRAFGGGVFVQMPENVAALIPWSSRCSLNEIVTELGGELSICDSPNFKLYFGTPAIDENSLEVVANGWQAGVLPPEQTIGIPTKPDFTTGGVAAGALGVAQAFLTATMIDPFAADKASGISLWNPELLWYEDDAVGPVITSLPDEFWILGLGHLGQGYLWNIGLLPFNNPLSVNILIQDFQDETIELENMSAGLVTTPLDIKSKKIEVCYRWLKNRNFDPKVRGEEFCSTTKLKAGDPRIALCGFDNAKARMHLSSPGFDYVVDAALGRESTDFDKIAMHTFPSSKTPFEIWGHLISTVPEINKNVVNAYTNNVDKCGVEIIAGKAIATSFVGAFAGALVLSELIRRKYYGTSHEKIVLRLRRLGSRNFNRTLH